MSAMSDYLEGILIDHMFRTATFTKPTTIAIALCTAAPVDSDTGSLTSKEVANSNAYARATLNPSNSNWDDDAGGNGATANTTTITFATASGNWGTITHVAITDSTSHASGNLLLHGALTSSKVVQSGDTFKFNAGDLDIVFA